jgi:hypothetical protein
MLFSFDPGTRELARIDWVSAADAGVTEAQIEKALASCPASLFAARKDGEPVLVVKTSKQGTRMPESRRGDLYLEVSRLAKISLVFPRYWGCSRRMRRGAIEWTFIGWNEMRA